MGDVKERSNERLLWTLRYNSDKGEACNDTRILMRYKLTILDLIIS